MFEKSRMGEAVSLNSYQEIEEFVEILARNWQRQMLLPRQLMCIAARCAPRPIL